MFKILCPLVCLLTLPVTTKLIDAQPQRSLTKNKLRIRPALQPLSTVKENSSTTDTNSLQQSGWYAGVMRALEKKEYEFSKEEGAGVYTTPNRKNNLRFYYTKNGFTVQPRTTKTAIGKVDVKALRNEVKYTTLPDWKIAFTLNEQQTGEGAWQVNGNQAQYNTDLITVQYNNDEAGMRQNFVVKQPLTAEGDLKIHFNITTTLQAKVASDRLQFIHKKSGVVLNYDQLKVWDANGQPLEASFEKSSNDYCIHVQSNNAAYPITIDPLSSTPAAMVESNQASAGLGLAVASAGDVNGDGYSDVIVGSPNYDSGQTDEGAAFVYHGSATGISTTFAAMVESNRTSATLGSSVASAGDVNNDGYSDVVVGAASYNNGQANEGAFYVYHGSASGISTTAARQIESNQVNYALGTSVACAGDVNGDGYSDIVIGAPGYNNGQANEGAFYIYHGTATGIGATAAATVESNQVNAVMGTSVASAGDVNGDGYSDVIVGAPFYSNGEANEGAAFIYHGTATGINTTAAIRLESNQNNARSGMSVASAGDVNGDGYSDIMVGAYLYDNGQTDEGAVFIYHGSASGVGASYSGFLESNQTTAYMGYSVACVGDVNGDGYSDVVIGAYQYDNGQTDEGVVFVYQGSSTGVTTTGAVTMESNQNTAYFGLSVASAGDVNGDGFSDVIAGAPYYDSGQTDEGAAFVYHGAPTGINTTAGASLEQNQANACLGATVASAGDVNGDGYSDVIVAAYFYDNGQTDEGAVFVYHGAATGLNTIAAATLESNQSNSAFGYTISGAGDVNGDGYSDIVVGASQYDNGQTDEGVVFIYHGSATGINTTAAIMLEKNQANLMLGYAVSGAGDVNGDGYSDVIVGAYTYSNGESSEGAAFIYYGSATGIAATSAVTLESNVVNAYAGYSVAGAGDVNGDGFADVVVGAPIFTNGQSNEGAALVYYGSATGVTTTIAAQLEANQAGAFVGYKVAAAGDVNGDGYQDVAVAAPLYDNGQTDEGVVFIYHGSASGLSTTAAAMMESNQANSVFGYGLGGGGDVNGDGYSDIVVGAYGYDNGQTDEGAAFVYHGSPSGINTTAAAFTENNQASAYTGYGVAMAGDVNGDGYGDVVVGSPQYGNGQTYEGVTFIYYGNNSGNNKRNNLDLYNTDLTTPVNAANYNYGYFGAGLFAKSFIGRQRGKLVWETRAHYNAYSGTPITNNVSYTNQQTAYTNLGATGVALKNVILKRSVKYTKIRARVKYNPATAITGQVYGPWRYVPEIVSAASLGVLPVELTAFHAAWLQKGQTATIQFALDHEWEMCCYEIEKSSNGVDFSKAGRVEALNTNGKSSYQFTDSKANGNKIYYRLKMMYANGNVEYSNLQLLEYNAATEIMVFPNPATDVLKLLLNANYTSMHVQIMNSAGQIVQQLNASVTAGQTLTIPVNNLKPGNYYLYLQNGSDKQVLQFIKQ